MNISFTGYKNIGSVNYQIMDFDKKEDDDQSLFVNCVNLQLTNKYDKDLDTFERVLKRYPNNINRDFVTLMSFEKQDGEFVYDRPEFMLNFKPLNINDENLWIFEKLAAMLDSLAKKDPESYEISEQYLESEDCQQMLNPGNFGNLDEIDQQIVVRLSHEPQRTQKDVESMSHKLEKAICDYMA